MKIIIILIYIILFILLIYFSINIEKYTNMEINKLDSVNMYGNLTIKTKINNFDNINTLCIKNQCIDIDKLNKLPYQKGISGQCTKDDCTKVCKCPYGTAPEGEDCKVHEKEICISCGSNYRFDYGTKTCIACEGGKFIDDENHIRTVCCSETEKYDELGDICSKKTCQCENGEADNENCQDETVTKCKNCNKDYYLTQTPTDSNNYECLPCEGTQNGNRDKKCCPKGQHYDFTLDDCLINRCTCDGGYPTEGEECEIHESEDCSSCKGGITREYYYYSPSAIEGNKCITCNPEGTTSVNMRKMYSDNHRTTMCCNREEKYDDNSGGCINVGANPDNLCRDGEIFNWEGGYCECPSGIFNLEGGYCECPSGEIYDLTQKICKKL